MKKYQMNTTCRARFVSLDHYMENFNESISFIWSIAEILRGSFKQSEYGRVILPFTVLRRLDCVLEPSKDAVMEQQATLSADVDEVMRETQLSRTVQPGL